MKDRNFKMEKWFYYNEVKNVHLKHHHEYKKNPSKSG